MKKPNESRLNIIVIESFKYCEIFLYLLVFYWNIQAERIAAYEARKAAKEDKKGKVIAKSNIILDIKPWDDETDMKALEDSVRSVAMDGLLWGTGKLVAVGYGIKKLQITCVVEDDKVGTDDLEDQITAFDDYVQSVDIVAFNKI